MALSVGSRVLFQFSDDDIQPTFQGPNPNGHLGTVLEVEEFDPLMQLLTGAPAVLYIVRVDGLDSGLEFDDPSQNGSYAVDDNRIVPAVESNSESPSEVAA